MGITHLRESLTILACFVILVLAVALAGPYCVDWNTQRNFFEDRLSGLIGERIRLSGAIDLKLLPVPYFEAANIAMGAPENPFSLVADKIRLELSLPPLLRGEFAFTELQLKKPVFQLKLDQIAPNSLANLPPKFKFERITLDDATISVETIAPGKEVSFQHLHLEAEADSLLGPFRARASLPFAGMNPDFSLSTGAAGQDKLDLKLAVETGKNLPAAAFTGKLLLAKERLSQSSLMGEVQLEQHANLPWTLKGNLSAGLQSATLGSMILQWGGEPLALTASGDGSLTYPEAPKASLNLKIASLDLDRFLEAGPALPDAGANGELEFSGKLKRFLAIPGKLATPLPVNLTLEISNLLVSNAHFSDISASILFSQSSAAQVRAEGYGAARARLSFDGSSETGDASGLSGQIEWASPRPGDLPDFMEQNIAPWGRTFVKAIAASGPLVASGAINLTAAGFFAHNLDLRQGPARLTGTLDYLAPEETQRGRLFAALNASQLAVQSFSAAGIGQLFSQGPGSKLDLSVRFNADSIDLNQSPEPPVNLAKVKLKILQTAQDFRLDELEFSQTGGTRFRATGEIGQDLGHFNVSFDAVRPAPFARLLQTLWPLPAAFFMASQEQIFAPAHARFSVDANRLDGQMSLQNADLDTNFGATKFHAFLEREEKSPQLKFDAVAIAPEATALWQQFGLSVPSSPKLGPGNLTVSARSKNWGSPVEAEIHAADSATSLDLSGVLSADFAAPKGTGELDFKSRDITPYLIALSKTASGAPWITWQQTASKLPLNLVTSLHWDNEAIKATHLAGEFAGTGALGELTYSRQAEKALLEGSLELDNCSLGQIVSLGLGAQSQPAKGMLWPEAPFGQGLRLPFDARFKVSARNFVFWPSFSGKDTNFEIAIFPQTLVINQFFSNLADGTVAGNFRLNRQANLASLEAKGDLRDFQAELPLLRGKLGMQLNFAGAGTSVLGLVKSLAGGGEASLADAVLSRSDPKALGQIFAKAASEEISSLEHDQMNALLDEAFSHAPLTESKLGFDLNLSDGHLRFGLPASPPQGLQKTQGVEVTGDLDLAKGWLTEKTKFSMQKLPRDWLGPRPEAILGFKGPLAKPVREIDSTSFSNALAEQSILKESERITNFEFDLHERTFFYERLRSERRREQDKLKLRESLQDKGDDDRRRAAELARSEHSKKDDQKRPGEEERSSGGLVQQSGATNQLKGLTGSFADPAAAGHY